jgi:hypothetical protein
MYKVSVRWSVWRLRPAGLPDPGFHAAYAVNMVVIQRRFISSIRSAWIMSLARHSGFRLRGWSRAGHQSWQSNDVSLTAWNETDRME